MTIPLRHFNTFLGDPVRAILTQHMNKIIEEDNLIDLVNETGSTLKAGLEKLAEKHPRFI